MEDDSGVDGVQVDDVEVVADMAGRGAAMVIAAGEGRRERDDERETAEDGGPLACGESREEDE